jgi:hypothetical protein
MLREAGNMLWSKAMRIKVVGLTLLQPEARTLPQFNAPRLMCIRRPPIDPVYDGSIVNVPDDTRTVASVRLEAGAQDHCNYLRSSNLHSQQPLSLRGTRSLDGTVDLSNTFCRT